MGPERHRVWQSRRVAACASSRSIFPLGVRVCAGSAPAQDDDGNKKAMDPGLRSAIADGRAAARGLDRGLDDVMHPAPVDSATSHAP